MNKEELKSLVKSYFQLVEAPVANESKETFASATLADGTELSNDKESDFAVGDDLFVKDSEGSWVAAPSGEHTTSSGIVVTVSEEGKITGVKYPDEAGEGSLEEFEAEEIAQEVIEEAIDSSMSPEDVIEAAKAVIEELVMPQLEEMKAKMQEYEMAYKEKMSEPAALSAQERKFAAIEKVKANKGEGLKFNAREAQLESIIKKAKKQPTN